MLTFHLILMETVYYNNRLGLGIFNYQVISAGTVWWSRIACMDKMTFGKQCINIIAQQACDVIWTLCFLADIKCLRHITSVQRYFYDFVPTSFQLKRKTDECDDSTRTGATFVSLSTRQREKLTRNVRRFSLFWSEIVVVTSFAWISHSKTCAMCGEISFQTFRVALHKCTIIYLHNCNL